ncbi:MAG: YfhO family protein, partial [Clostridia bacterium]|nr:YfhO family protein [Clostridia bacterium]
VNDEKLAEGYEILKSGAINIETFKETYIKGTIKAEKDQIVFTSIPYDKGWSVKIDGKAIKEDDYISLENAYLCFSIPEGEHTVELKFTQRGLLPGAAVSLAALIILIAVYFIVKKKRPDWDRRYEEKCEKALADYENMKEEMRLEAERIRELDIIPDEFMAGLPEGDETEGDTVPDGSEAYNPAESTGDYPEEETAAPESPAEQEQEETFSDESGIPQVPEEQTYNTDPSDKEPETDGE